MNKNFIFYASNVSQLGLRFIQMIIITRLLSSVDLGIYYAAAAYPQLLSRVFDLGLPHAVRYYILQMPAAGRLILKLILIFTVVISLPIIIIFYFMDYLPVDSKEIVYTISNNFIVLAFYCVLLIVNSIFLSVVISFEKFRAILLSSTLPYLIFITAILFQYYYASTLEVRDVLFQLLVSELVSILIYLIFIFKMLARIGNPSLPISFKGKEFFRYALQIYPSGFLKVMTTRLDKVVLSFIAPPVFIGYYSVLMTIRDVSIFPVTSYGQLFMNKLTGVLTRKKHEVQKLINGNIIAVLVLYLSGFVVFFFAQEIVLKLFFKDITAELLEAALFLFLSTIPLAMFSFLTYVFLSTNNPKYISYSSLISIVSFYGFVYFFYTKLGSECFLYASLLSTLIGFIYLFIKYKALLCKRI